MQTCISVNHKITVDLKKYNSQETVMHVRKCTWNIFDIQELEMTITAVEVFHHSLSRGTDVPHTSLYKVSLCASESDCNFEKDTPCF